MLARRNVNTPAKEKEAAGGGVGCAFDTATVSDIITWMKGKQSPSTLSTAFDKLRALKKDDLLFAVGKGIIQLKYEPDPHLGNILLFYVHTLAKQSDKTDNDVCDAVTLSVRTAPMLPQTTCDKMLTHALYLLLGQVQRTKPALRSELWELVQKYVITGSLSGTVCSGIAPSAVAVATTFVNMGIKGRSEAKKTFLEALKLAVTEIPDDGCFSVDDVKRLEAAVKIEQHGYAEHIHQALMILTWFSSSTAHHKTEVPPALVAALTNISHALHYDGFTPVAVKIWELMKMEDAITAALLRHNVYRSSQIGSECHSVVAKCVNEFRILRDFQGTYRRLVNWLQQYVSLFEMSGELKKVRSIDDAHDVLEGIALLSEIFLTMGDQTSAKRIIATSLKICYSCADLASSRSILVALTAAGVEFDANVFLTLPDDIRASIPVQSTLALTEVYEPIVSDQCHPTVLTACNEYIETMAKISRRERSVDFSEVECPFFNKALNGAFKNYPKTHLTPHLLDHVAERPCHCRQSELWSSMLQGIERSIKEHAFQDALAAAAMCLGRSFDIMDSLHSKTSHQVDTKTCLESIPENTVLCCVVKGENGSIYLMRHTKNNSIVQKVVSPLLASLTQEFKTLLLRSNEHVKEASQSSDRSASSEKEKFWTVRKEHDADMANLMSHFSDDVLGSMRILLLGDLLDSPALQLLDASVDKHGAALAKALKLKAIKSDLVRLTLNAAPLLCRGHKLGGRYSDKGPGYWEDTQAIMINAILTFHGRNKTDVDMTSLNEVVRLMRREALAAHETALASENADDVTDLHKTVCHVSRQRVWLLLDSELQQLPWECLSILKSSHAVRIPSLRYATEKCRRVTPCSFGKSSSVFYSLNPTGDIDRTQKGFSHEFRTRGWKGVEGRIDVEASVRGYQTSDVYMYLGHGCGDRCTPRRCLLEGRQNVLKQKSAAALALMMGCSSGRVADGPSALPLALLSCGTDAVVCTLWDVTDGEIDRCTRKLIESIFDKGLTPGEALANARDACKLQVLTGYSLIMYGC
eukprot:PhF_6_TR563/c0_g1_i1/m.548/K02365/ESP1; separase